jgi:flagellar hook-basal body protein
VQALKTAADPNAAQPATDDQWTYELGDGTKYTVVAQRAIDQTLLGYKVFKGEADANNNGTFNDDALVMSLGAGDFDPETCESLYVMEENSAYSDPNVYTVDQNTGYITNSATGVVVSGSDQLNALQIPRTYTLSGYLDSEGNPLTVTLYSEQDSVKAVTYKYVTDNTDPNNPVTTLEAGDTIEVTGEEYWALSIPVELSSISIGSDGTVSGVDSSNRVMTLGKIAVANVPNPTALEAQGDTYYMAKANTGVIEACNPGEGATGSLMSGALEMSNVDLSTEFTDMITTQRGYQANARIITVTDSMLEELVNLKRS